MTGAATIKGGRGWATLAALALESLLGAGLGGSIGGCSREPLVFGATTDESARASILAMSRGMSAAKAEQFPRVCEIAAIDANPLALFGAAELSTVDPFAPLSGLSVEAI